jgi:hypothetical protein
MSLLHATKKIFILLNIFEIIFIVAPCILKSILLTHQQMQMHVSVFDIILLSVLI